MGSKPLVSVLLEARAAEHPDAVFLRMRAAERTWKEFQDDTLRVAHALYGAGVRAGDRVAILLPNCPEFLPCFFGATEAGALPVPLNTGQQGEVLAHMLRDAQPRAVVVDSSLWSRYASVRIDGSIDVVRGDPPVAAAVALSDVFAGPSDAPPVEYADGGGTFGVLYTSGTTGPPKGVVPTRTDISPLVAMWQAMDVKAGETIYTCLPLFHGNPLGISVMGAIFLDAAIAVSERFSASRFWDEVRAFNAVEFNHVGAIIPILLKQELRSGDADNPMRVCLSAGCPPHAWESFERRFGVRIVEQFSMVDAPGYLINLGGPVGSMGVPAAGCEAAILDDAGAVVDKPDVIGELAIRATEGRTHYYLNAPETTEESYRGGWFHTGDLAYKDASGWFYYAGRKKESMRRRGENVSAWEVENVVNQFPGVLESAAHAVPSPLGEDDIKVVVVPQPSAVIDVDALIEFCRTRMAKYAVPRYIEVRDEIPKTPTQRPRYAELKAEGITPATLDLEEN